MAFGPLIQLDGCNSCPLQKEWRWLTSPVMPMTEPKTKSTYRVLIVGEAPGEQEDRQGKPFVGQTGQLLRESISQEWQDAVYWTNVARCRPPQNRTPTELEIACCTEKFLAPDLVNLRPHAILAIGGIALSYFWSGLQPEKQMSITAARGVWFPVKLADDYWTWCYASFHPSYVARGKRKNDARNTILPVFQSDLKRFFAQVPERAARPPVIPTPPTIDQVAFPTSKEEVKSLWAKLPLRKGYDIETIKLSPFIRDSALLSTAFSGGGVHFAFPVNWPGTSAKMTGWGIEAFRWCLEQAGELAGHNFVFELVWSLYYGTNLDLRYQDSMGKPRIKYGRKTLLSLGDQTRLHLGVDIKTITNVDAMKILEYPLKLGLYYNALDAWGSEQLIDKIALTPIEDSNYQRILRTIRSTATMQVLGLPVNLEASYKLKQSLTQKLEEIQEAARKLPQVIKYQQDRQKTFSLSSPADVGAVLVTYYGLKLPETAAKNYTTDEETLSLLGEHPLANLVLEYREVGKQLSTYVKPIITGELIGTDKLLHPSYTSMLTATGRLSAEFPNIQNFPKRKHREVREQVVPPPGYYLVACDYGQLEARVIAMRTRDTALVRSFINKEDIHSKWLDRLVQRYPKYLDRLATKTGQTSDKDIRKAGRDIIKTDFVFASFYGSVEKSVADRTGIPLEICKELLFEFWKEYAEVKNWVNGAIENYQRLGFIQTMTGMVRNEILPGNEPINNEIQGTAAHIVLDAQNALHDLGIEKQDFSLLPRLNVHDDLGFFVKGEDLEAKVYIIGDEMTKPRYPWVNVPLVVEVKLHSDWANGEEICRIEGAYFANPV